MINFTTFLGLGFILGLKHAFDTDHIVAISTIANETKNLKKSSWLGILWGLGHTTILFIVGSIILIFKLNIPKNLALFFELLTGIILIFLGLDVLGKIAREKIHWHKHFHDSATHIHFHSHKKLLSHRHTHKSFIIGAFHGLAGSATLIFLVLATTNSILEGILYVLIFGLGSIVGMLITSSIINLPFLLTKKLNNFNRGLKITTGALSIALGFVIMYEILFSFT